MPPGSIPGQTSISWILWVVQSHFEALRLFVFSKPGDVFHHLWHRCFFSPDQNLISLHSKHPILWSKKVAWFTTPWFFFGMFADWTSKGIQRIYCEWFRMVPQDVLSWYIKTPFTSINYSDYHVISWWYIMIFYDIVIQCFTWIVMIHNISYIPWQ